MPRHLSSSKENYFNDTRWSNSTRRTTFAMQPKHDSEGNHNFGPSQNKMRRCTKPEEETGKVAQTRRLLKCRNYSKSIIVKLDEANNFRHTTETRFRPASQLWAITKQTPQKDKGN